MVYELKKIDLWSTIKVTLLINIVIGVIVGILFGLFFAFIFSIIGGVSQLDSYDAPGFNPAAFGVFGGFMFGIYYAVLISVMNGFVMPLILILLYNLFAGWIGGIKLNFAAVKESSNSENIPDIQQQTGDLTGGNN